MNKKITSLLLITAFVFVGCTTNPTNDGNVPKDPNAGVKDVSIDRVDKELKKNGVTVQLENNGENSWEYSAMTNLPDPCHEFSVEVIVAESFPEQVTFNAEITAPSDPELACAQVIQPAEQTGVLQVNEKATFTLKVERN